MPSKLVKILLFFTLILFPLGAAQALDTKTGNSIYVPKDEIINGNLYAAGDTITINGSVSGDLIVIAQTISINGRIEGDIIAVAQNITVNGEVGGNVRVAGEAININGSVARNVNLFGENIILGDKSLVGWDVMAASGSFESRGSIDGDLTGSFGHALISGKIGKDANIKISKDGYDGALIVSQEANIGNHLFYTAKDSAQISEKAKVGGGVERKTPQIKEKGRFASWLWSEIYLIFCALVVGLVMVTIGKNIIPKIIKRIDDKPFPSLLRGFILMFALPLIAFFLLFTLIGIPLALIISAWWLIAIYVAKILTAILVGQTILKNLDKKREPKLIWSLILGIIICWLLFAIPLVGWIFCLAAIWFGLGGFVFYASHQLRHI